MMQLTRRTLVGCGLGLAMQTVVRSAEGTSGNWTSWRGPNRDSFVADNTWPRDFSGLQQVWSKAFSDSYSGPVIYGDQVFTTETIERRDEAVAAINLEQGQQVWKQRWPGAMSVPFFAKSNGDWIRATPATDGRHIVVAGMRDMLKCFDCASGQERWTIDFNQQTGTDLPAFGLVCSPLIDGEHLYIHAGGAMRKLNLADGSFVWETLTDGGGMYGGSFSSPMIATICGQRQLVVQTREKLAGVSLETGQPLWQSAIKTFRGMNILTPTVWNDHVFTSAYGGKSSLLKIERKDSGWSASVAWTQKAEAYMSSPVLVDGHVYMHLKNSRFCCIDLAKGEETWRTTPFGKYWSMITNGKQIVALDERGELLLIEANPAEFALLDRKKVSDAPSWAHLAISGDRLVVRQQKALTVYRWA